MRAARGDARPARRLWHAYDLFCRRCRYGIAGLIEPAACPMCGGSDWVPRMRVAA